MKRRIISTIVFTLLVAACGNKPTTNYEKNYIDKHQAACLTRNVYHEARGEPFEGQIAVARVTLNRAKDLSNICSVVFAKKQFSWDKKKTEADTIAYYRAHIAAHEAFNSTFHATHFHATYVKPKWSKKLTFIKQIGKHKFYS